MVYDIWYIFSGTSYEDEKSTKLNISDFFYKWHIKHGLIQNLIKSLLLNAVIFLFFKCYGVFFIYLQPSSARTKGSLLGSCSAEVR